MKLSQLRALVAVADCGNFSEAALELQLSQPAVSHAIATLEEELGVPLFARGRHGAVLTPAGERILYHAHQALQHLVMMQREADLHKGLHESCGRIDWTVAVSNELGIKFYERMGANIIQEVRLCRLDSQAIASNISLHSSF